MLNNSKNILTFIHRYFYEHTYITGCHKTNGNFQNKQNERVEKQTTCRERTLYLVGCEYIVESIIRLLLISTEAKMYFQSTGKQPKYYNLLGSFSLHYPIRCWMTCRICGCRYLLTSFMKYHRRTTIWHEMWIV